MVKLNRCVVVPVLCILTFAARAQESETDFIRSDGKIYVVMAVVVTIVLGLVLYLWNLDKKISKIEKKN